MTPLRLLLFADYFQFYIQDETAAGDLSRAWDGEAVGRLLAIAPGTVAIGTVRNTTVPVILEMLEAQPDDDWFEWDQVIEATLKVASGKIVVAGCIDYLPDARRIEASPNTYRVRVSYGGLDTVSADGLTGNDRYRLQLWADAPIDVHMLKPRAR